MQRYSQKYSNNMLLWTDIATSAYLPLFLSYLYYNHLVLLIGNVSTLSSVSILSILEVLKFIIYVNSQKSSSHKHFMDFIKLILIIIVYFSSVYIVAVLFGAAVFSNIQETFMFSFLMTSLTALPVSLHFGAESAITMFLSLTSFEGNKIQNLFMLKVRLALLGAWLGALVIPLDWNRPWQNWPIPCCIGTIIGYMIANWICVLLLYKDTKLVRKSEKYSL